MQPAPADRPVLPARTSADACAYCSLPVPRRRRAPRLAGAPDTPPYCCYGCALAASITRGTNAADRQLTLTLARLGAAILLTMNVMVFATLLYGAHVYPQGAPDPAARDVSASAAAVFRYLSLFFTLPVIAILGLPIAASALRETRRGVINTDLLIVVGVVAAFLLSYVAVLRDSDQLYFDTCCVTLVLVTLGKYLEAAGKLKTSAAIAQLAALLPDTIERLHDGQPVLAPAADARPGDLVRIRPGARIPVDGVIVGGAALVDEQIVTGESQPVRRGPGDTIHAGTLCIDGLLTSRVTETGSNGFLARVLALLDDARRSRGRWQRLADRLAALFVPAVVALAVFGAALTWRSGPQHALMTGLAVLLISCPCAVGLATPMALAVAVGSAARRGILFRTYAALENLASVDTLCFDKTGTLTTGRPQLTDAAAAAGVHEAELCGLALALADATTHHLGANLAEFARRRAAVPPQDLHDVRTIPGRGVVARLHGPRPDATPMRVALGSPALMAECGFEIDDALSRRLDAWMSDGRSVACVGAGAATVGVFAFSEELRPAAAASLHALEQRRISVRVLTGDHARRAEQLARSLSVPVEAELLPADKVERIRALVAAGRRVAMVGDGLNDAPALAAAHVGVAMGCGADLSRDAGDVCLLRDDLGDLPWALDLARRTRRVIVTNLLGSFAYNVAGIGLALAGTLTPVFAAVAMVASSLLVVGNSLRLGTAPPQLAPVPSGGTLSAAPQPV